MMNAKRSSKANLTRYAFLVPAVVVLLFVFSLSKAELVKQTKVAYKSIAASVKSLNPIIELKVAKPVKPVLKVKKTIKVHLVDTINGVLKTTYAFNSNGEKGELKNLEIPFKFFNKEDGLDTGKVRAIIRKLSPIKADTIEVNGAVVTQEEIRKISQNSDGVKKVVKVRLNGKTFIYNQAGKLVPDTIGNKTYTISGGDVSTNSGKGMPGRVTWSIGKLTGAFAKTNTTNYYIDTVENKAYTISGGDVSTNSGNKSYIITKDNNKYNTTTKEYKISPDTKNSENKAYTIEKDNAKYKISPDAQKHTTTGATTYRIDTSGDKVLNFNEAYDKTIPTVLLKIKHDQTKNINSTNNKSQIKDVTRNYTFANANPKKSTATLTTDNGVKVSNVFFSTKNDRGVVELPNKLLIIDGKEATKDDLKKIAVGDMQSITYKEGKEMIKKYGDKANKGVIFFTTKKAKK